MLEGKDGYDCFKHKPLIVDRDNGQLLSLLLRNYFRKLSIANAIRFAVRSPKEIARDKFAEIARRSQQAPVERKLPVIAPKKEGRIVNVAQQ